MALDVLFDLSGPYLSSPLNKKGCLGSVALNQGWFCSPVAIWQHLQTCWLPKLMGEGCCWYLMGQDQGCCSTSFNVQDSPHNQESSDHLSDKSCVRWSSVSLSASIYYVIIYFLIHSANENLLNTRSYIRTLQEHSVCLFHLVFWVLSFRPAFFTLLFCLHQETL